MNTNSKSNTSWVSRLSHASLILVLLAVIGYRVHGYFSKSASDVNADQRLTEMEGAADYRVAGRRAFANEQWSEAADAFEELTRLEPDNIRAWVRLAYSLHASGQWDKALAAHMRVSQFDGPRAWACYNIACVYALKNESRMALDFLQEAIESGFRRQEPIANDPDLKSLLDNPEFQQLAELAKPVALRLVYRQFDFLLGHWQMLSDEDRTMGTFAFSRADKPGYVLAGECWDDNRAITLTIFSHYEPASRKWKQTWLDQYGTVTQVESTSAIDDTIVLEGDITTADGVQEMARITFQEVEGDFVHHTIQRSRDSGTTWETLLEATLVRQERRPDEKLRSDEVSTVDPPPVEGSKSFVLVFVEGIDEETDKDKQVFGRTSDAPRSNPKVPAPAGAQLFCPVAPRNLSRRKEPCPSSSLSMIRRWIADWSEACCQRTWTG